MMRSFVLAVLLLATSATAQASVLYTLVDRICSVQAAGTRAACNGADAPKFQFDVSDAAVARGSFDLVGRGLPASLSGDVADLISVEGAVSFRPASGSGFAGDLAIHARFAADGALLWLSYYGYGSSNGAALAGTADAFGGWFDDEGLCQHDVSGRRCTQTGRLQMVHLADDRAELPEPATTPLLLAGLITAFGLWRSRRDGARQRQVV